MAFHLFDDTLPYFSGIEWTYLVNELSVHQETMTWCHYEGKKWDANLKIISGMMPDVLFFFFFWWVGMVISPPEVYLSTPKIPLVKKMHISRAGGNLLGLCPVNKSALVKYYISLIRPSPWNKLLGKSWKEILESKHFSFLESTVYKVNYFSGKIIKVQVKFLRIIYFAADIRVGNTNR